MDKVFLKSWSEYLFQAIQPEFDGGVFSIFNRENETEYISKASTYVDWAKSLVYKPHFNISIGFSLLWSIILFITVIVLLIRLCCRKLDCCLQCKENSKTLLDSLFREYLNRKLPHDCCVCAKKEHLPFNQDLTDRAILVTVFVLIFGLIAGIYYSVTNCSDFQNSLTKSNSSYTLLTSVDETIGQVESFLNEGISKGNISTLELISKFNKHFTKELNDVVYDLSNNLLTCFGALPTLKTADTVIGNIDKMYNSMTYISKNKIPVFKSINGFLGAIVNFIKPIISRQLGLLCNSKPDPSYRQTCRQLVNDCERLVSNLREKDVRFDSISTILHLLKLSNLNFASLSKELETSKKHIKTMIASMHYEVNQNFKIDSMLASVPGIWILLDKSINSSVKTPINEFQKSKIIEKYSCMLVKYWKYFFDGSLAVLVWLGVTFIMTCATAVYVFVYTYLHKQNSRKEAYKLNLVELYQNQKSQIPPPRSRHHRIPRDSLRNCRANAKAKASKSSPDKEEKSIPVVSHLLKVLTIFHLFWGGVIILPCLFASASFLIGGVLTTEVCRYLVESKGVAVLDSIIDPLVSSQWDSAISKINLSSMILPIHLKQPQHPMRVLYSGCASSNSSLIVELNMTGIFNATAVTEMPLFTNMVASGEGYVIKQIQQLNLQHILPTTLVGFIDQGVDFMKKYIDSMDHKPSIIALQKPILKMDANQFAAFVLKFDRFLNDSDQSNHNVIGLKNLVKTLKSETIKYRKLTKDVADMRSKFQTLERLPPFALQLTNLKSQLVDTSNKLKDKNYLTQCVKIHYPTLTKSLTSSLVKELGVYFHEFETSLFPCKSLHSGYSIMVRSICGDIRYAMHSYTLSLVITIIWVQMLFYFSWRLLSRMKPKISSGEDSKC